MSELSPLIAELTWSEAQNYVQECAPTLCKIINQISPSSDFKLYKMTYRYGDIIYDDGMFNIPDAGLNQTIPLASSMLPSSIKEKLSYQSMPLGFLLTKSFEVYRTLDTKISPIAHRKHGLELGVWETFSPPVPNIVTAGARSIFMLPKVSDSSNHNRLKIYGVKSQAPTDYFDQHQIFKEIAHCSIDSTWECELLLLDMSWKKHIFTDEKWKDFKLFLLEKGIMHSNAQRIIGTFETALNNFFKKAQKQRIKYAPHTIDLFKHLLLVLSGSMPAFKPVTDNENVAPLLKIYDAYLNVYDLKNYYPSMVYADYFDIEQADAVYYSLKTQAHLQTSGHMRKMNTFKKELFELIDLIERFTDELKSDNLGAGSEYLLTLFNKVVFNYFHSDDCNEYGVLNSSTMPELDKRLCFNPFNGNDRIFSDRNPFVNGCIKISTRNGRCFDES